MLLLYAMDVNGQDCLCENEVFYHVSLFYWGDGTKEPVTKEYIIYGDNNIEHLSDLLCQSDGKLQDGPDVYHAGFIWSRSYYATQEDSCLGSASQKERYSEYMALLSKWIECNQETSDNEVYDDIDPLSLRVFVCKIIGRTRRRVEDGVEYRDIVHIESIKPIHITVPKP